MLVLGESTRGLVVAPSCAPSATPVGCWSSQRWSGSYSFLKSSELKCIWGAVIEVAYWPCALVNSPYLNHLKTALEAHSCAFPHAWIYPIFWRIFPYWSPSKFDIFAEWNYRSNLKTFSVLVLLRKYWVQVCSEYFSKSTVFAEGCIFHPVSYRIKNSARKDEFVGCAVEASTAYDNIINAIKAAEEAANKAGNAADSALSVSTYKWPNDGILVTIRWGFLTIREAPKKDLCVLAFLICLWALYELLFCMFMNCPWFSTKQASYCLSDEAVRINANCSFQWKIKRST